MLKETAYMTRLFSLIPFIYGIALFNIGGWMTIWLHFKCCREGEEKHHIKIFSHQIARYRDKAGPPCKQVNHTHIHLKVTIRVSVCMRVLFSLIIFLPDPRGAGLHEAFQISSVRTSVRTYVRTSVRPSPH